MQTANVKFGRSSWAVPREWEFQADLLVRIIECEFPQRKWMRDLRLGV